MVNKLNNDLGRSVDVASLPAINIDRVSKDFEAGGRSIPALKDISLTVAPGEFLCLVGRSGCGKSTLLDIVAGLQRPTTGEAYLRGKRIAGPEPEAGLVFQRSSLFPWLTVEQNVRFAMEARGKLEHAPARLRELIDLVGLGGCERSFPAQLSGGMAQRVALARTLAAETPVLLFDEPLAALDAFTRRGLQAEIERIWQQERFTALFVTHDIEEAVYLGSRLAIMSPAPGRIQSILPIDLPRPRSRANSSFLQLCADVLRALHEEPELTADYAI